ncbi:MAG: metal-dependent hydrolase, partial [Fervidicoccus fontis]
MTEINYYGHSAFEIQLVGLDNRVKTVLIDPWITNPLSKAK